MVRQYKRKGKTPWPDKNKRMAAAVRKRAEGKSLREIANELGVDHHTVIRDLRRWEEAGGAKVVHFPGASRPAGGNLHHPDAPPAESVPRIRRVK